MDAKSRMLSMTENEQLPDNELVVNFQLWTVDKTVATRIVEVVNNITQ